jgi:hypothetical protein
MRGMDSAMNTKQSITGMIIGLFKSGSFKKLYGYNLKVYYTKNDYWMLTARYKTVLSVFI